jgi:hypothetical protein
MIDMAVFESFYGMAIHLLRWERRWSVQNRAEALRRIGRRRQLDPEL